MRDLGATLVPHEYTATFIRNGSIKHKCGSSYVIYTTALLADIKDDTGKILTDHIWLVGKIWKIVHLCAGDIVSFTGTPYRYIKGYSGKVHEKTDFESDICLRNVHVNRILGKDPNIVEILSRYNITADDDLNDIIIDNEVPEDTYMKRVNDRYKALETVTARRDEHRKAYEKRKPKKVKLRPYERLDDDVSFQKFTHKKSL